MNGDARSGRNAINILTYANFPRHPILYMARPPEVFPTTGPISLYLLRSQVPNSEPVPLPRPVYSEAHIRANNCQSKEYKLHEKPRPAATSTLRLWRKGTASRLACVRRASARIAHVEILCPDGDDVVVIRELASFGGEAKVGNRGNLEVRNFEAVRPFIFCLVLQVKFERFILEIGKACSGGDLSVADAPSLSALAEI